MGQVNEICDLKHLLIAVIAPRILFLTHPFLFRFRALGRLESKFDETMVEYYLAFMAMCKRIAGLPLSEEEGRIDVSWLQNESFSMFSAPNICPCHR